MIFNRIITVSLFSIVLFGCNSGDKSNFIDVSGTTEVTDITLSSKTSGEVLRKLVEEGNRVKAGDTLIIIDSELHEIRLRQAEAALKGAGAKLQLLLKGARTEDVSQAEEMFKQTESNYLSAQSDFNRMKNLLSSQSITQKQFDDASTRYEISQSQLNAAKQNLSKLKNLARPEEIEAARANYDGAKANFDLFQKNISDCFVVSPINGFVLDEYIKEGEMASPLTSLLRLADISVIELYVYISEVNLGQVKLNQRAGVSVDSFPDKEFEGKVTYIAGESEFTPKNIQTKEERTKLVYKVKILIPNPDQELKGGMPADAKIYLD